jgi:carbamoyltransferase
LSTIVLGISAFYHDSAAALVRDGEIIAAAQEERFSRKKHDPRFPHNAINYCLEEAFIEPSELDAVVFYDNPVLTWDRILKNCLMSGEKSGGQFEKAAQSVLGIKLWVKDYVNKTIGTLGKSGKLLFTEHHMAHAASAFYPSPFSKAAIITLDGVGEWATTTLGLGTDSRIELFEEIDYPHSLGLLYSAFTYFCGFKVNSGEYKLMGLAPYGRPVYYDAIRKNLIDIKDDGSYRLNPEYFGYLDSLVMTNERFNELFGGAPREPESRITRREMDMAASIQKVTEEVVLKIARHVKKETKAANLVLAGGVALNCVANGVILKEKIFDNIWIQPAAGDAGGALGAALLASHVYFDVPRKMNPAGRDSQKGSYLGPAYSSREIAAFLDRGSYSYERVTDAEKRAEIIAKNLADGKIVGYFNGRMEFGPRALGARSIIGDPRRKETQSMMNLKIKYRESFRPFAPSVLAEDVNEYFQMDVESPYMLLVALVKKSRQLPVNMEPFYNSDGDMLPLLNQPRSDIPAVTHVDYSARVQTVNKTDNPEYYRVIKKFKELTGFGVIVNTSFNVRGEPIVCSPQDAYKCFMRTEMDLLVLEDYILYKEKQPAFADKEDWKKNYVPD